MKDCANSIVALFYMEGMPTVHRDPRVLIPNCVGVYANSAFGPFGVNK